MTSAKRLRTDGRVAKGVCRAERLLCAKSPSNRPVERVAPDRGAEARRRSGSTPAPWTPRAQPAAISNFLRPEELTYACHRFPGPRLRGEHSQAPLAHRAELARSRYG